MPNFPHLDPQLLFVKEFVRFFSRKTELRGASEQKRPPSVTKYLNDPYGHEGNCQEKSPQEKPQFTRFKDPLAIQENPKKFIHVAYFKASRSPTL